MNKIFTESKLNLARKMSVYDFKRNKFSTIFNLLKDDIIELIDLGLPYKMILMHINNELDTNIKYDTFLKWINKTLKRETKKNMVTNKESNKPVDTERKSNYNNKKFNDDREKVKTKETDKWWEKRIENLAEGMEETKIKT